MNDHTEPEALGTELTAMTEWTGGETDLWKSALQKVDSRRGGGRSLFDRVLNWSMPKAVAAGLGIVLLSAVAVALLLSPGTAERSFSRSMSAAPVGDQFGKTVPKDMKPPGSEVGIAAPTDASSYNDRQLTDANDMIARYGGVSTDGYGVGGGGTSEARQIWHVYANFNNSGDYLTGVNGSPTTGALVVESGDSGSAPSQGAGAGGAAESGVRSVVRKATIELTTNDVRAAFLKASHLVSEASGEYVQESTLSGDGETAQGNLTLRIAADRLCAVLNELRGLGAVQSENVAGDDVTAQMVDIDARLRNEQRVEMELLELMDKRSDAPLKEILELRDQIGRVRGTIEQLRAGQERLSRLVSLATILVIIRPEAKPVMAEPQKEERQTIGQYFGRSVSDSWRNGLLFLSDTVANLLSILVGGIIWWALVVFLLIAARQAWRRRVMLAQS